MTCAKLAYGGCFSETFSSMKIFTLLQLQYVRENENITHVKHIVREKCVRTVKQF